MKTNGKISKILPSNLAEVICEPNQACEKCKGCSMAGSGEIIVQAANEVGAKVGDRVEIDVPEAEGIKAALIIFIFPIIGLLVGYFIAQRFSETESAGVLGALMFMALTFLVLNLYDRYIRSKNKCIAKITKIND